MPDTSAELQSLPWGPGGSCADVAAFVSDLGHWLQHHDPLAQQPASALAAYSDVHSVMVARAAAAAARRPEASATAWRVGRGLLRQAVLWGLSSLATLLLECLLALPSVPPAAFAQLMHAPPASPGSRSSSCTGLIDQAEKGSRVAVDSLGSMLHLGLLSPRPVAMLQAALGWARRWGNAGGGASAGFTWRWGEPNAQVREELEVCVLGFGT